MSARFRAVVWDVDGVLIDSEPLHFAALAAVCARRGYRFGADENRRWLGRSLTEMWAELPELGRLGLGFDELRAEWIAHYLAQVHAGMARRPAPAIVAHLAARGVPQAAASSSPRRIVDANIAVVGLGAHVAPVLAVEDVARGKPAPDLYLAAAHRLGLAPADCLAVEDTDTGVAAAKAAGLTAIAWPNAMTAAMDFSAADFHIDDLAAFDWECVAGAQVMEP